MKAIGVDVGGGLIAGSGRRGLRPAAAAKPALAIDPSEPRASAFRWPLPRDDDKQQQQNGNRRQQ